MYCDHSIGDSDKRLEFVVFVYQRFRRFSKLKHHEQNLHYFIADYHRKMSKIEETDLISKFLQRFNR